MMIIAGKTSINTLRIIKIMILTNELSECIRKCNSVLVIRVGMICTHLERFTANKPLKVSRGSCSGYA